LQSEIQTAEAKVPNDCPLDSREKTVAIINRTTAVSGFFILDIELDIGGLQQLQKRISPKDKRWLYSEYYRFFTQVKTL
jgi:hypothetical protein